MNTIRLQLLTVDPRGWNDVLRGLLHVGVLKNLLNRFKGLAEVISANLARVKGFREAVSVIEAQS